MNIPCFKVIRTGRRWGVTELSLDWVLAEFDEHEQALDYARSLAADGDEAILEGEDESGRLDVRHTFQADSRGVMHMKTVLMPVSLDVA